MSTAQYKVGDTVIMDTAPIVASPTSTGNTCEVKILDAYYPAHHSGNRYWVCGSGGTPLWVDEKWIYGLKEKP